MSSYFFLLPLLLFTIRNQTWFSKQRLPPSSRALPIIDHLHLLGPLIHHSFNDLSSKHGPLLYLRLGSIRCIVASTPELAKELLKANDLTFSAHPNSLVVDHLTYNSTFAFAPNGPYWKFIKRLITTELLGNRTLNQFLPIRTKELHQFIRCLVNKGEAGERVVNVSDELLKLTSNIVSQMMLSIRCSGTDSLAKNARGLAHEVTKIFGQFNRIEDVHKRYDALIEKIITDHEELRKRKETRKITCYGGEHDVKDILDILLDAFVRTYVIESSAIEWSLAELINHPTELEKAGMEIDKVAGNNRLVEESDCPRLPYTQAIIKETLRLHPPIPLISRKSMKECNINGYVIPAETLLFSWENPMEFRPERFLQSNEASHKGQHFQLLPFGTGRRGCPGLSLAMQEVPTILAVIIQCFDWRVISLSGVETNVVDMTKSPGLIIPRTNDLVYVPVPRFSMNNVLDFLRLSLWSRSLGRQAQVGALMDKPPKGPGATPPRKILARFFVAHSQDVE
ncbi:hypothetical protein ACJW30_08G036800 [Castanea mollissima]